MSDQKNYHTYKKGNKIKHITTLAGLKRFSTVNTDNTLSFLELLEKNNFTFHHNLVGEISKHCRLCHGELPVFKIIEEEQRVLLTLCACSVSTPLAVNRNRFLSIIPEEKVDEIYNAYCEGKMRKWTTSGIPIASLDFKVKKFGEEEGKKRYQTACKKMDSVSSNFFMSKGYSEEEANRLSKERQSTFTKEKCIAKYGEGEGLNIWSERQKKWQDTLNNKPIEEIERINQDKVWKSGNVSKISQRLFEQISIPGSRWGNRRNDNHGEKLVIVGNLKCLVDFSFNNKIIEFFGDYWHANPGKYSSDKMFIRRKGNRTAKEIWEEDTIRISTLQQAGYDIMIVWESDFRRDPEKVISKCQKFLNS